MNIRFILAITSIVIVSACTTVPINKMNTEVKNMQQKVDGYSKQVNSVNNALNNALDDLEQ